MAEKVSIPEDMFKFYYEGMNGGMNTLVLVVVNEDTAVVVDDGFQPVEKPDVLPSEADDFLANEGLELVSEEDCPDYDVDL